MRATAEQAAPLVDMIREAGYKAVFDIESRIIESKMSGLKIGIFYSTPGTAVAGSIQFYCGMELSPDRGFGLEQVNAANRKYRFAKFYLDKEGDLAVEADFPFFIDRAEAAEDLERMIGLWEGSLSLLKDELAKADRNADEPVEEEAVVPAS